MSGDDHHPQRRRHRGAFDLFKQLSPPGCVVATGMRPVDGRTSIRTAPLTPRRRAAWSPDGFEIALHPSFGGCTRRAIYAVSQPCYVTQLGSSRPRTPSMPAPSQPHALRRVDRLGLGARSWSSRTASGWTRTTTTSPALGSGSRPGFLNGSRLPMRFADTDGTPIDVYQQNTNMNDESSQAIPPTVNALLDNALGPNGYYGAFGANIHNEIRRERRCPRRSSHPRRRGRSRSISYRQLLDLDGRPQRLGDRPPPGTRDASRSPRPSAQAPTDFRLFCPPGTERHARTASLRRLPEELHACRRSRASRTRCSPLYRHLPGDVLIGRRHRMDRPDSVSPLPSRGVRTTAATRLPHAPSDL